MTQEKKMQENEKAAMDTVARVAQGAINGPRFIDPSYTTTVPGQWIQDAGTKRWWYRHNDGTYIVNGFEYINGEWYCFDGAGWMLGAGWHQLGSSWYYMNASGAVARNQWIDGLYYVGNEGYMYADIFNPDGYYVDSNGKWDGRETWMLRLQKALKAEGYNPGTLDGILGPNTLAACPTLQYGSQGQVVALLQEILSYEYICPVGEIDGSFGTLTEYSVKDFQMIYGLTVDGIVGRNTWSKLLKLS